MYRIAGHHGEDCQECICLKCFGKFVTGCGVTDDWKFCPLCGTKWDGVFTKRNPRYNQPKYSPPDYKLDPKTNLIIASDKPRLIVERGIVVAQKLASDGFFAVQCKPEKIWHLMTHTTIGWYAETSAFVSVFRQFKKYVLERREDFIRLRLLVGTESRIIKEWAKS